MEWIDALRGATVGLDTGPLIYYIEEHPAFLARIKPFFEAAELRARHNLPTPDAMQIATAIRSGASWFLTNDAGLANLSEISVLVLKQLP
jgi:predicted nucleic acid-binding protein